MTTFTTIASGSLAIDKPGSSTLMLALRDNPIAIIEGDATAPRIKGQAMARLGDGLDTLTVAASDAYTIAYGLGSTVGTLTTTSTSNVIAHTYTMTHYSGVARFRASHSAGGGTSTLGLYRNGVLASTSYTTTSGAPQLRTVDLAFSAGDVVTWRHKDSGVGSGSDVVLGALSASDAYVPQYPLIPASLV